MIDKNAPVAEQIGADRWFRWEKKMEEARKLKPGRELDLLVAEKVMGLELKITPESKTAYYFLPNGMKSLVPPYSTDHNAAFEVVKKMKAQHFDIDLFTEFGNQWRCKMFIYRLKDSISEELADTAPHAICLAALKAKGVEA